MATPFEIAQPKCLRHRALTGPRFEMCYVFLITTVVRIEP
jgi:hypothetical protein